MRKPGKQERRKVALEHEALTERIIGAAIEVHRCLGPGFLESVYEKALIIELKKRGLRVQDQMEVIILRVFLLSCLPHWAHTPLVLGQHDRASFDPPA
jgi:hypothetical protein